MTATPTSPEALTATSTSTSRRRLSVASGTALYIGAVLGTGVIALPALAAQAAGPASLLAWLALVLLSMPLAWTFAALGARYPDAGGVSTYVRKAFGPRTAAVTGWCFYFAVPAGAPAAALFGGGYVAAALGGGQRTAVATAAGLMIAVTLTNALGVRFSGRVQLVLAGLLVTFLIVAVAAALPYLSLDNLRPFAPHGWPAVGLAAALLVWGFAGWEAITHLAADFRRPARDLPRAATIAVVVVGVLYLAVAATSILVLGATAGSSGAPLAELLALGIGGNVEVFAAAAALLLTFGAMNAYYAAAAKLGAALGRDGALPAWLARGSTAGKVPRRSLALVAGLAGLTLAAVAVASIGPAPLVLFTTGSFVLVYVLGTAAALRLLPPGSRARRWAYLALIAVTALLVMTGWYLVWPLVVAASALLYLRLSRRRPALPRLSRRRPALLRLSRRRSE